MAKSKKPESIASIKKRLLSMAGYKPPKGGARRPVNSQTGLDYHNPEPELLALRKLVLTSEEKGAALERGDFDAVQASNEAEDIIFSHRLDLVESVAAQSFDQAQARIAEGKAVYASMMDCMENAMELDTLVSAGLGPGDRQGVMSAFDRMASRAYGEDWQDM